MWKRFGSCSVNSKNSLKKRLDLINQVFKLRKSPFKLAGLIGWDIVLRLVIAQIIPAALSIHDLEKRISSILNMKVKTLVSDPSIGSDVDNIKQLEQLTKIMNTRARR